MMRVYLSIEEKIEDFNNINNIDVPENVILLWVSILDYGYACESFNIDRDDIKEYSDNLHEAENNLIDKFSNCFGYIPIVIEEEFLIKGKKNPITHKELFYKFIKK